MSRYRNWYPPYVSVAQKKHNNKKMAEKLAKDGMELQPIAVKGRKIASSFWGKAWCDNVESYQDYENRLPRGRSYVRNGAVIDLEISTGNVKALVAGSSTQAYEISIDIKPLEADRWETLKKKCLGKISSLFALVQGKLLPEILQEFCNKETGLFPAPKEIKMNCSCPDWADLCKHLAAVLYGIGARLDEDPKLFFVLRGIKESDLLGDEVIDTLTEGISSEIAGAELADVFDMDLDSLDDISPAKIPETPKKSKKSKKKTGVKTKTGAKKASTKKAVKIAWNAKQVQKLRKDMKFTQAELAKHCKVTSATISNWECERSPVAQKYHKILNKLIAKK